MIPPLYLIRAIYKLDRIEKEPRDLLVKLFFLGVVGIAPAMVLEVAAENLFGAVGLGGTSVIAALVENFIGVALVEECVKYFILKKTTFRHPAFDFRFDAIVYSVVTSLGFAAAENVMYVFLFGGSVAAVRAVTSIPGHAIFGIYMGHYYGMAKYRHLREDEQGCSSYLRLAVLVPVLLHGFYDFCLSTGNDWMVGLFLIYVVVLDVIALKSVKRFAEEDQRLDPVQYTATDITADSSDFVNVTSDFSDNEPDRTEDAAYSADDQHGDET